jgi:head-tail adaptor
MLIDATASPVYRLRPGRATDSYGEPVDGWATPDRRRLLRATVQADSTTEEDGTTRRLRTDERVLFVSGRADLTADDRIEFEGVLWRVEGEPIVRRGLAAGTLTSAHLRRFTG